MAATSPYTCVFSPCWDHACHQDFESNTELRAAITDLLEEMVCNSSLLPTEHKTAASILRTIYRDIVPDRRIDLEGLLQPTKVVLHAVHYDYLLKYVLFLYVL